MTSGQVAGYEDIRYEAKNGVATIVINRPEAMNALRPLTVIELTTAFRAANSDGTVGVVVLRGEGTRAFCVGGDQKTTVSTLDPDGFRDFCYLLLDLFRTMRGGAKPIVAAVRGWCIGGGHELHCFADLTIADHTAQFGQVGAKVGGAPLFVTRLLPKIVGEKKAREILYQCKRYSAHEALEMGLINEVVAAADFDAAVDRLTDDLLAKSPTVLRAMKMGVSSDDVLADDVVPLLIESLAPFFGSAEQREATTAFAEKREPDFQRFRVAR
jgi:naphthoate synthase/2-ketocyclohexanecarboxyl-CoA hydrolase